MPHAKSATARPKAPSGKISAAEVDAGVASGHSGFVGGFGECVPVESDRLAGNAGFDLGAALGNGDGVTKAVGTGEKPEDARGGGSTSAICRSQGMILVWVPVFSIFTS